MRSLTASPGGLSSNIPTFSGSSRIVFLEAAKAPDRIPLHPFGEFVGNGTVFLFDEESLSAAQAQLAEQGTPWVLDLHHQTLKVEEGRAEEAPAAGFIGGLEVGDGYVYGLVEWTDFGREKVETGQYAFVSPVFYYDPQPDERGRHRVLGYHSFALTNTPGIRFQRRILAEEDMQEKLRKLLGLQPEAKEEEVEKALLARLELSRLGELTREILGIEPPYDAPEVRGRLMRLSAADGLLEEVEKLRRALESLEAERREERARALVEGALKEGRILPHQRDWWLDQARRDPEAARMALEGMPKLVPTTLQEPPRARKALEEDPSERIRRMLGISDETWKKFGGEA